MGLDIYLKRFRYIHFFFLKKNDSYSKAFAYLIGKKMKENMLTLMPLKYAHLLGYGLIECQLVDR